MAGTSINVVVDRVVDGDTIRVFLNQGDQNSESLRILALDTEEVNAGTKPVTPLGHRASDRAKELIQPGDQVKLIFPGNEPIDVALQKYRGNFGRLLVYVELADGRDFQEIMIEEGLSPYFMKYGYAHFALHHQRYIDAERRAQIANSGIWDQINNNGSQLRDYAALTTWWDLRARIIEGYRDIKRRLPDANVYNTRLDYQKLHAIAEAGEEVTVFMELRSFTPIGSDHIVFQTGSLAQPYSLFIPEGNNGDGEPIMRLLLNRYVADGETAPRRSYAYVTGPTNLFPDNASGRPQVVVTDPDQITDWPDAMLARSASIGNPQAED